MTTGSEVKRKKTKEDRAARLLEVVEAAAETAVSALPKAKLPNEIAALVNAASAAASRGHELLMGKHTVLTGADGAPLIPSLAVTIRRAVDE